MNLVTMGQKLGIRYGGWEVGGTGAEGRNVGYMQGRATGRPMTYFQAL